MRWAVYVANKCTLNMYETFVSKAQKKTVYIGDLHSVHLYGKMLLEWVLDEYVVRWGLEWTWLENGTFSRFY
jgi:hypothetical protein